MEVNEIDSIDTYDFRRARLCADLKWLLSITYGSKVPTELREPLPLREKDTLTSIYVNTGLVGLLVNARLYIQAFNNLFPKLAASLYSGAPGGSTGVGGHWPVIEGLSRLGFYVEDDSGQAITEQELTQTNPFHLSAHVTLIETMMAAYLQEYVTAEKVVQAIKAIGPFNASEDLPIDSEDALLVWMNKVAAACIKSENKLTHANGDSNMQKRHAKSHGDTGNTSADTHQVPVMDDILKDICDGCNLAMLIAFYCPDFLKFSDIHLTDPVGIGESLSNLSLVRSFCVQHLPIKSYHFAEEDLLYTSETIKPSLLAFLTQLFQYFVIKPLDIVRPKVTFSSKQVRERSHTPVKSLASREPNTPTDLISNATKQSFHNQPSPQRNHTPDITGSSRTNTKNSEQYGSNPSLSSSSISTSASQQRLLHKRASQLGESASKDTMHDTLSPIVVRKSQSMSILNNPDPKQSLVAWESKPYYVDRSKNGQPTTASNGSTSLLSNVSFDPDLDDQPLETPNQSVDINDNSTPVNSSKSKRQTPTGRRTPSSTARSRYGSEHNLSSSYQKLLDRSADIESPLKQFAKKHGFNLSQEARSSNPDTAASTAADAKHSLVHGEATKPTTPAQSVEMSKSDLTKISPRTDSELSPRQRTFSGDDDGSSSCAQSYVISTAYTKEAAEAAGIPIVPDAVGDSCTDVTFTSVAADIDRESQNSPIQPIEFGSNSDNSRTSITNFADISRRKSEMQQQQSKDFSCAVSPSSLKQRFEHQKQSSQIHESPGKPKKTTFSLNQTTWTDNASMVKSQPDHNTDSDSNSESLDGRLDRKQFSDVKILLEEKRKAMEKKKAMEAMQRTQDMNTASKQAFMKAVSKNKSQPIHENKGSEALKAFSRSDIAKSIENLTSKWEQDEKSNAKRVAATVASRSINVTPAPLDHISEASEFSETDAPKVPLPSGTATMRSPEKEKRKSSIDLHEEPLNVKEFGLDKLNASISELRGEMRRIADEQKRIEELQNVMKTASQAKSVSKNISKQANQDTHDAQSAKDVSSPVQYSRSSQPNIPTDNVVSESVDKRDMKTSDDLPVSAANHYMTSSLSTGDDFAQPSISSISQSTEEPFILHKGSDKKKKKSSSAKNLAADRTRNDSDSTQTQHTTTIAPSSQPSATSSPKPATPTASGGFLSSSQLSKRKSITDSSDASVLDLSTGRRRWSSNSGPLFPGYSDEKPLTLSRQASKDYTEEQIPFQPPMQDIDTPMRQHVAAVDRQAKMKATGSSNSKTTPPSWQSDLSGVQPLNTPQRVAQSRDLSMDTPAKNSHPYFAGQTGQPIDHFRHAASEATSQFSHDIDTPMRGMVPDQYSSIDTPMRGQPAVYHGVDTPMRNEIHPSTSISIDTPMKVLPLNQNGSMDTPVRGLPTIGHQHYQVQDTPERMLNRQMLEDTPVRHAKSNNYKRTNSDNNFMDTPLRDAMKTMNPSQMFYVPPSQPKSPPERDVSHTRMSQSYTDTPMRQAEALSRHGTAAINPPAQSLYGTKPATSDQPLDLSGGSPLSKHKVVAPYAYAVEQTEPVSKPYKLTTPYGTDNSSVNSSGAYKLDTPYGTANNELNVVDPTVSLSSVMDAIRNDMRKQTATEPVHPNLAFSAIPPTQPIMTAAVFNSSLTRTSSNLPVENTSLLQPVYQSSPPYNSNIENAFSDIGSSVYPSTNNSSQNSPAMSGSMTVPVPVKLEFSMGNTPPLQQQGSLDDDRVSLHSSSGSDHGTPRTGRPKRPTWDMSTPKGELLNQPGVGFIVAEQAQQPSEDELQKRKEKVMMMQLKRREEQERKKQQKAAEQAAKAEEARKKEAEAERKKNEEKAKKEAILAEYQMRKAEEDIPPENRAQFRQRQNKRNGQQRPASIHWSGSPSGVESLNLSDNMTETGSSFTVSLAGGLTHRRPISPAVTSSSGGNLTNRSKAPSRGPLDVPSDEYTGPKLYVKPSEKQKSNRHIIINAISHCCLAGVVNTEAKNKVLEEIARSDGKHFLILFRDGNQTYKAIYSYCPDATECTKLHGQGPKHISDDMCERFYKYNSGGKKFTEVLSTKHLSVSIDAITIHNHLWQKRVPTSRR